MNSPCWLALTLMMGADPAVPEVAFPAPPRLATTAKELAKLKESKAFPALREQAVRSADALLKAPVPVPVGWGNWVFYYACPDDASPLNAINETEHQCPQCKKVHRDERTIAAYRTLQHDRVNDAALQHGWAFAYTGEDRYAKEAQRILLKLADDYKTYPARRDRWGRTGFFAQLGGRRYSQSLDEAVGVIKLAKAYDLTRTSTVWTDKERQHVEQDFFRLTADTLLYANQGINNHQTWYNAGLMTIASVLGDKELVQKVLTMRGGFHDQLKRSLGKDGVWYEGTMAYHNYALQAMREIIDAGRRMGLPLHNEVAFRRMLESPLGLTYPNGQFPAINDSDHGFINSFGESFRWAWEVYGEERFAQAFAGGDPVRLASLLGAGAKPKPFLETRSTNLEDSGLAILRRGQGADSVCVMLDHGPHGGSHGHFDKLNIVLYAGGREWLLDPGRLTYSHKEYKTWVKHTAAHNTVTLGGTSQQPTTGKFLWLKVEDNFVACAAETDRAYPGSVLRRSLLLTENMLVDLFEVETDEKRQIDWFAHAASKLVQPVGELGAAKEVLPGKDNGYEHLTGGRGWMAAASTWDFMADGNKRLRVWFAGVPEEQIIASTGIGYTIDQKVPCLIRRVQDRNARFATVYDLTGTGEYLTGFTMTKEGELVVQTRNGEQRIRFTANGGTLEKK